jgi:hypothetical protein
MSITERLQTYIQESGLNVNKVTVRCGLRPGTLNKALKYGKSLNSDTVEAILKNYTDLSAEWLLLGYGPMRRRSARVMNMESGRELSAEELARNESSLEDWKKKVGPPDLLQKQLQIQQAIAELLDQEDLEVLRKLIDHYKHGSRS